MSAWTVDNGHVDVLVNALAEYGVIPANSDFHAIGQDLWRENYRSVNYRYSERSRTPRYKLHTTEAPLHPVAVLKAIGCYNCQTCEHSGYEKSNAYRLCRQLRDTILTKDPELARLVPDPTFTAGPRVPAYYQHPVYNSAPWGFSALEDATVHVYEVAT